jgi:hypothetical protein
MNANKNLQVHVEYIFTSLIKLPVESIVLHTISVITNDQ